mgnify:CR=1 FL=1
MTHRHCPKRPLILILHLNLLVAIFFSQKDALKSRVGMQHVSTWELTHGSWGGVYVRGGGGRSHCGDDIPHLLSDSKTASFLRVNWVSIVTVTVTDTVIVIVTVFTVVTLFISMWFICCSLL